MFRTLSLTILFLAAAAAPARGQFETGSILGTITDASGAVVDGAMVTVTSVDTGISQTRSSDAAGNYEFVTLRIGTYIITAEKPGFAITVADDIRLTVGDRLRVNLSLPVGGLTEQVQVTATTTLLETDTSQRGQLITGEQTRALPRLVPLA
jgi:Carboxypeptidase regulatory-like domain